MIVSDHAAARLRGRGITMAQVDDVLRRHIGPPNPGDGGNLVYRGTAGGRTLNVVTSPDGGTLVTAYWSH